jgi:hypothetical protein
MGEFPDERALVRRAQSKLEGWTRQARTAAYAELFEGDQPLLEQSDLRLLDEIDSALSRRGDGLWGTDRYGIHTSDRSTREPSLGVVCVYHPQVTADSVLRGRDDLDDETERRLNEALWDYSERVSTLIEAELDAFLRRARE